MKKVVEELKKLDLQALKEATAEERKQLQTLRVAHALEPIENPMKIRQQKKSVARMLTVLNQHPKV